VKHFRLIFLLSVQSARSSHPSHRSKQLSSVGGSSLPQYLGLYGSSAILSATFIDQGPAYQNAQNLDQFNSDEATSTLLAGASVESLSANPSGIGL